MSGGRIYRRGDRFAQIPEWIVYDERISDRAVRLFAILDRHAGAKGRAWPGKTRLGVFLRCARSSVERALRELEQAGAIAVRPSFDEKGAQQTNNYWLWPANPDEDPPPPVSDDEGGPDGAGGEGRLPSGAGGRLPSGPKESQREREPEEREEPRARALDLRVVEHQADDPFEAFWVAYPRRVGKPSARKAFDRARKKLDPISIVEAARAYAADPNLPEPRFVPHPATWLNEERWNDGPLPPRTGATKTTGRRIMTEDDAPTSRVVGLEEI